MIRKDKVHRSLIWLFWISLLLIAVISLIYIWFSVPDHLNLVVSEEEVFDFSLPPGVTFISESEEVVLGNSSNIPDGQVRIQSADSLSLYGTEQGRYHIGMKLFGVIKMKEIQVDVVESTYAVPGGNSVGIYLQSDGVMVIGTGEITNTDGNVVEPSYGVLKSGDYIEKINGESLEDKDELIEAVNACCGENICLEIRRNGEVINIDLEPVLSEDGNYKLGAWVRDDTQGIGTMTYVDENGSFGALGHGISDSDTGQLIHIRQGELYETKIMGIEKGKAGTPGVMAGVIYYGTESDLGHVVSNTEEGIFGNVNERLEQDIDDQAIPIGFRQDVKKGHAVIRSDVSGEVREYDIEIQRVDQAPVQKNKGMMIQVVDEELLELTGGIVQGMSGSPIIQDGKLVGAVTHVLVNDPTRGYGIFIENMLDAAG